MSKILSFRENILLNPEYHLKANGVWAADAVRLGSWLLMAVWGVLRKAREHLRLSNDFRDLFLVFLLPWLETGVWSRVSSSSWLGVMDRVSLCLGLKRTRFSVSGGSSSISGTLTGVWSPSSPRTGTSFMTSCSAPAVMSRLNFNGDSGLMIVLLVLMLIGLTPQRLLNSVFLCLILESISCSIYWQLVMGFRIDGSVFGHI